MIKQINVKYNALLFELKDSFGPAHELVIWMDHPLLKTSIENAGFKFYPEHSQMSTLDYILYNDLIDLFKRKSHGVGFSYEENTSANSRIAPISKNFTLTLKNIIYYLLPHANKFRKAGFMLPTEFTKEVNQNNVDYYKSNSNKTKKKNIQVDQTTGYLYMNIFNLLY